MKIRIRYLLSLGALIAAVFCCGTLATWKLAERRRHLEDAQRQVAIAELKASEAEKAKNAALAQAEVIKREAINQAEAIKREVEATKAQAEETRRREEAKLTALYPNLRKLVPGDNPVNERYLESFKIEGRTISVKMVNNEKKRVYPTIKLMFLDASGLPTARALIAWGFTALAPGETRSDEDTLYPTAGPPFYYTVGIADSDSRPEVVEDKPPQRKIDYSWIPKAGDRAEITFRFNISAKTLMVAADVFAYGEMAKSEKAQDGDGLKELYDSGRMTLLDVGTPVLILEVHDNPFIASHKVLELRVLDGPHKGQRVFAEALFVARFISPD